MHENEISKIIVDAAIEWEALGLVIDFGKRFVKDGIHRVVNGLQE